MTTAQRLRSLCKVADLFGDDDDWNGRDWGVGERHSKASVL